jgi:alkaline phosphatase
MFRLTVCLLFGLSTALPAQGSRARNVVLFLADAGGIPTVNAASWHGYNQPRKLFIQRMPNIGLSDTSPVRSLVSDSAAGMTAIVTGEKTLNGVIGMDGSGERGKTDGKPLKTILEYAEERGLATGIITNDALSGATPASLYAKANDRASTAAIFQQVFTPRFGDGPDVMIGPGRAAITKSLAGIGVDLDTLAKEKNRPVLRTLGDVASNATRAIVLLDSSDFDVHEAIQLAVRMLSRNSRGYFLMVEWDTHTDNVRRGLDRMVALDKAIEQTAKTTGNNTLLLFTADHSFDLRVRGGDTSRPLLDGLEAEVELAAKEKRRDIQIRSLRMQNSHTGEEVLVAARGPGAERVRGYMANTDIFQVMLDAFGWKRSN